MRWRRHTPVAAVPREVTEAGGSDDQGAVLGAGRPQREVVLEVLGGQIRGSDLLDVLVDQLALGMRVHDDQLVLAEKQCVQAGIG